MHAEHWLARRRLLSTVLVTATTLSFSLDAGADEDLCPDGRIANAATAGHCCWPGQTWDANASMCTGRPSCPANFRRDGLVCVRTAAPDGAASPAGAERPQEPAPATSAPPDAQRLPPAALSPATGRGADAPFPDAPRNAQREKPRGRGFIIAGAVTLGVGYFIALASASVGVAVSASDHSTYGASCASSSSWAYVPLFGPFVTLANYPDYQIVRSQPSPQILDCNSARGAVSALVWTSELLQIGGAAMLATGIVLHRSPSATETTGTTFEIHPGTELTAAGATFVVRNF